MGWFGRILTFEIVADVAPSVGTIVDDIAAGAVDCAVSEPIGGYAATGRSMADAIEPLVESFAIQLRDTGGVLRSLVESAPTAIADDELGCSVDEKPAGRIEREQEPASSLPGSVLVSYYDRERDYQTGQARSDLVDQSSTEEKIELPAVVEASNARSLAEQIIARRWAQRDKLVVRLPPEFTELQPGDIVSVPGSSTRWQVAPSTIEGMVTVVELRPSWRSVATLAAEAGRALPGTDVVMEDVALALVELPDIAGNAGSTPTLYLAASTPAPTWKRLPVEISSDGFAFGSRTAARKSVLGMTSAVLGEGPTDDLDTLNSIEVQLIDDAQWLSSCDDATLAAGANLALVGDELFQFADAEAIGPGTFRLSKLLRGRFATEGSTATHSSGELFLLIEPASLQSVALPPSARGAVVTATYHGAEGGVSASLMVDGRSLRTGLFIDGEKVVGGRVSAISSPAGGLTVDAEVRTAVSQILGALRTHGLIDS